jgi:hypothetical protein
MGWKGHAILLLLGLLIGSRLIFDFILIAKDEVFR